MNYLVIMPAYDEENYIGRTIDSLILQSLPPAKLVVVDDGSRDATNSIAESYCRKYPWIHLVKNLHHSNRAIGTKVVEAFNLGYQTVEEKYDFIVKMDADLSLPPDYFKTIAGHFVQNPKLGIAGGRLMVEKNDRWFEEYSSDRDHVKGACKSYRSACFRDIGGILASIGWDTADELLARYHGWQIFVDLVLEIKHHRKMGSLTGSLSIQRLAGHGMYRLRYGLPITFTSAIKAGFLNRPHGLTGLMVLIGWFQSWINKESFIVGTDEGRFIRNYRLHRMMGKVHSALNHTTKQQHLV